MLSGYRFSGKTYLYTICSRASEKEDSNAKGGNSFGSKSSRVKFSLGPGDSATGGWLFVRAGSESGHVEQMIRAGGGQPLIRTLRCFECQSAQLGDCIGATSSP